MLGKGQKMEGVENGAKELRLFSIYKGEEYGTLCVVFSDPPSLKGLWPWLLGLPSRGSLQLLGSP